MDLIVCTYHERLMFVRKTEIFFLLCQLKSWCTDTHKVLAYLLILSVLENFCLGRRRHRMHLLKDLVRKNSSLSLVEQNGIPCPLWIRQSNCKSLVQGFLQIRLVHKLKCLVLRKSCFSFLFTHYLLFLLEVACLKRSPTPKLARLLLNDDGKS